MLGFLREKFEQWVTAKASDWKKKRAAKTYAGMSDDEILDTPHCPVCNRMMKLRTAKHDGAQFWGCSIFPKCKGTRAV
jgi:ssDNA-binding Zn-finger/Zn-ribbon topoisomerase 1